MGIPYEAKALDFQTQEHKAEAFLKINPNGKVPALVDDDFNLWESMAINHYLADKHKPDFLGTNSKERALVQQWNFWAISELQNPIIEVFIQKVFVPEDKRDQKVIDDNLNKLPDLLKVLDSRLAASKYLAGNDFTLADLNTASVATILPAIGVEVASYSNIKNWLGAISERPAFQKYQTLR